MNTAELLETIANLRLEKDQLLKEKEERDHEIEMLEDMNKKVHSILDKNMSLIMIIACAPLGGKIRGRS